MVQFNPATSAVPPATSCSGRSIDGMGLARTTEYVVLLQGSWDLALGNSGGIFAIASLVESFSFWNRC